MRNRRIILVILALFLSSQDGLCGLDSRHGLPLFASFTPDDYNAEGQCFDVAVTSNNLIYVANGGGVLQYDGNGWTTISGTEGLVVISIAVDSLDRVWVGSNAEAGVILKQPSGAPYYQSLSETLNNEEHLLRNIWRIHSLPDGIYFQSAPLLVRYRPSINSPLEGEITRFPTESTSYSMVSWVNGRALVKRHKHPVEMISGDDLIPFPATLGIPKITPVHCVQYNDSLTLMTGYVGKLILFSDTSWEPFEGEVSDLIDGSVVYGCCRIDEERFVLSSAKYGLVVFNHNGNILEVANSDNNILSSVLNRTSVLDKDGAVWVPLDAGVSRINFNSPIRISGKESGLVGAILDIKWFHGRIYVATSSGLYYKSDIGKSSNSNKFKLYPEGNLSSWILESSNDLLFVLTFKGVTVIDSNHFRIPFDEDHNNMKSMAFSPENDYFYSVPELRPIQFYTISGNNIESHSDIISNIEDVETIDIHNGYVWITKVDEQGVRLYRAPLNPDNPAVLNFDVCGENFGIKSEIQGKPFYWQDSLIITSNFKLFTYEKNRDKFVPIEESFGVSIPVNQRFGTTAIDNHGRLYATDGRYNLQRFELTDGGLVKESELASLIDMRRIFAIASDPNSALIAIGGDDGRFVLYDAEADSLSKENPNILITKVIDQNDSLIASMANQSLSDKTILSWPVSSIRFEYSLTALDDPDKNLYEYRLLGHSDEWVDWSNENYKDFNDLHEGDYEFQVRGKDVHANISELATFSFKVLPPWYRTIPAFLLWLVLAGFSIYGLGLYRFKYLERQRKQLEILVNTRTAELIEAQKAELREVEARKEIELEAQRLKTTSQLAITISHEFNNPLAVIMGRIDLAKQQKDSEQCSDDYEIIKRQTERMRDLIIKMKKIEKVKETDYAAGLKIIDLHSQTDAHPPN